MKIVTAFVTKYALTKGIIKVRGKLSDNGRIFVFTLPGRAASDFCFANDFFTDRASAIQRAEFMRNVEREAIHRRLKDLSDLNFQSTPELP